MADMILLRVAILLLVATLALLYLSKKYKEQKYKEQKEKFGKRIALLCTVIGGMAFLVSGIMLYDETVVGHNDWKGFSGGSAILVILFILIIIEEFELLPYKAKSV